jgi:peptidoglycan/LPS O-acetylase OafA/YrhL
MVGNQIASRPVTLTAAENHADRSASTVVSLGYQPVLDGLRGVAILLVLGVNSLMGFLPGGFVGVDIFFVLSGFLITTLLVEEWTRSGTISLKRFYARRALRLLPALFLLLVASCAYAALFQSHETAAVTCREAIWVLFYFANWMLTIEHAVGSLDHAWSLSVEEQFYFVWPVVLLSLLRLGVRRERVLLLLALLIIGSAAWRAALWHSGAHYLRLYYGSDARADALLIGCVLGLLFSWNLLPTVAGARVARRASALVAIVFLAIIALWVPHDSAFLYAGGFTLIALSAAAVLAGALGSRSEGILGSPVLVWIGRISYSLYLWHYPVFHVLRVERFDSFGWSPMLVQALRFTAAFVAACASFYLVERPFLRLKRRFGHGC